MKIFYEIKFVIKIKRSEWLVGNPLSIFLLFPSGSVAEMSNSSGKVNV